METEEDFSTICLYNYQRLNFYKNAKIGFVKISIYSLICTE
jgi:hypothetical protein